MATNETETSQAPKILVVDDTKTVADMLEDILVQNGYHVCTTRSGEEALRRLGTEHFDIVITDIVMPDVNGLDILKAIDRLQIDTDAIVVTAFADVDTAVEAIKLGAKDYITKPFSVSTVYSIVERVMRERES